MNRFGLKSLMMIDTVELYFLIVIWAFIQGHRNAKMHKKKNKKKSALMISQSFQLIWIELVMLLRLLVLPVLV